MSGVIESQLLVDTKQIILCERDPLEVKLDAVPDPVIDHIDSDLTGVVKSNISPSTPDIMHLTNTDYAGGVQLPDGWELSLQPKVTVDNFFEMFDNAPGYNDLFTDSITTSYTVSNHIDDLVYKLSETIMERVRTGLYKDYREASEFTESPKGRIDFFKSVQRPNSPKLHTTHRTLTRDIPDNQILLWTLHRVIEDDVCGSESMQHAQTAYHRLKSSISIVEYKPDDCLGRTYSRQNRDYEKLHNLCYILLDGLTPTPGSESQENLMFLVYMPDLYESFVGGWLEKRLKQTRPRYDARQQYTQTVDESSGRKFVIDLLVQDETGTPILVADIKYRTPSSPSRKSISQVSSYAESVGANRAYLIYPSTPDNPISANVGQTTVKDIQFSLRGDLDRNGDRFIEQLGMR